MNKSSNRLATENINKLIFTLSIPTITAQVINILYNIVDRIYIGHLANIGGLALTSLGVCAPIILIVSAISAFIGGGGAPLAAIALGQNNTTKAKNILSTGTIFLIFMGIIMSILIFIFQDNILYLFGATDKTLNMAKDYLSIYIIGTIFVELALGLNPFIIAQGKTHIAMVSVVIGAITNIILDPIFIYLLQLNIKGAAIATVISQGLSCSFILKFLSSNRSEIKINWNKLYFNFKILIETISLGISTFIMQVTEALIVIVFNRGFIKWGLSQGDLYIGALTVIQSTMQLVALPMSGLSQGVQPIISYNFGQKNFNRVHKTVKKLLIITMSITFTYTIIAILFPQIFASIFTHDQSIIVKVKMIQPIFMLGMTIFGIQMAAQCYFVGTNNPKVSLLLAMLRKIILLIPLSITLPYIIGISGVYIAEPISDIISATTSGFLLIYHLKNYKNTI